MRKAKISNKEEVEEEVETEKTKTTPAKKGKYEGMKKAVGKRLLAINQKIEDEEEEKRKNEEKEEKKEEKEEKEEKGDEEEEKLPLEVVRVSEFMSDDLKDEIKTLIEEAEEKFPEPKLGERAKYIKEKMNEAHNDNWNVIILCKGSYALSNSIKGTSITLGNDSIRYHLCQSLA